MKSYKGRRLFFKLMLILLLGISASVFPAYKYISSVLYEIDRYKAELGGAMVLRGVSSLVHTSFGSITSPDSVDTPYFKKNIDEAKKTIIAGAESIQKTSTYLKQNSTDKFNIPSLYSQANIDAFPTSRTISSSLLEMSDGALFSSGLYSDSATDRYLLMKICGKYFPKIYSGLFRLNKEMGIDGDKSQIVIIRDEILDDIEDLVAALRTLSVNFGEGNLMQTSSDKIYDMGVALSESIFSYHEFNPSEILNRVSEFETFDAQVWVYCADILVDLLNRAMTDSVNKLLYFCVEYILFVAFLSSLALAIAIGVRRNARRTAMLAQYSLTGGARNARAGYYSTAKSGKEFALIDYTILKAAEMREHVLEVSKKLSIICISNRNEIESAIMSNSKTLEYADDILAELQRSSDSSELDGGVLKAASRISETVGELLASMPSKEDISAGFNSIISAQAAAVEASDASVSKAMECVDGLSRLSGEIASIADRANLLSLNISIEVGKSGKGGGGLSILSEQIKILAKRTGVVVLDLERAAHECSESLSDIKSKINGLAAPLSARRREADKMLTSIGGFENSITSLSYAANRIEGLAEAREGGSFTDRLAEARETLKKAGDTLGNFVKISQSTVPIIEELKRSIASIDK